MAGKPLNTAFLFVLLIVTGCSNLEHLPSREPFSTTGTPAQNLQTYYRYRVFSADDGKRYYNDSEIHRWELRCLFEKNQNQQAEDWAAGGNNMALSGVLLSAALEGTAIWLSSRTDDPSTRYAWAVGIAPAAFFMWLFDWMADRRFWSPAVPFYKRN